MFFEHRTPAKASSSADEPSARRGQRDGCQNITGLKKTRALIKTLNGNISNNKNTARSAFTAYYDRFITDSAPEKVNIKSRTRNKLHTFNTQQNQKHIQNPQQLVI